MALEKLYSVKDKYRAAVAEEAAKKEKEAAKEAGKVEQKPKSKKKK